MSLPIRTQDGAVLVPVKAVPGASRDEIAGVLGDHLKVRVSAPPEGGKANKAIRHLLARTLGVKPGAVTIESGRASPQKVVRVEGMTRDRVEAALSGVG